METVRFVRFPRSRGFARDRILMGKSRKSRREWGGGEREKGRRIPRGNSRRVKFKVRRLMDRVTILR